MSGGVNKSPSPSNSPRFQPLQGTEVKASPKLERRNSAPDVLERRKTKEPETRFVAESKVTPESSKDTSLIGSVSESDKRSRAKSDGSVKLKGLRVKGKLPPPESGRVSDSGIPRVDVQKSLDTFEQNVRQWAAHGNIRARMDNSDKVKGDQPLVFRCFMNLPEDVADNILKQGAVPGAFRKDELGSPADQLKAAKAEFGKTLADPGKYAELCSAANDHKNNGMDRSNLVSATSDPKYTYGNYSPAYAGKYALAIAVLPDDKEDKVYLPQTMDKTLVAKTGNHMYGMKPGEGEDPAKKKKDFESEVLFGGGIDPKRILYAIKIEMAPPEKGDPGLVTGGRKDPVTTGPPKGLPPLPPQGNLPPLLPGVKTESAPTMSVQDKMFAEMKLTKELRTLNAQLKEAGEPSGKTLKLAEKKADLDTKFKSGSGSDKMFAELQLKKLGQEIKALGGPEKQQLELLTAKMGVESQLKSLKGQASSEVGSSSKATLDRIRKGGDAFMKEGDRVEGSDGKTYECKKILAGGAHGTYLLNDTVGGAPIIWKPAVTSSGKADTMMQAAETGATALADRIVGGGLVPVAKELSISGKAGTAQPYKEGDGATVIPEKVQGKQVGQMIAHMLGDWIVSNHDNNSGQFLTSKDGKDLIGFDKGQAFKHFSENGVKSAIVEKSETQVKDLENKGLGKNEEAKKARSNIEPQGLDPGYHPSGNFKEPAPKSFMDAVRKGEIKVDTKDPAIQRCLENCRTLTPSDVKGLLEPYAKLAFPGKEKEFYEAVAHRAQRAPEELSKLLSATTTGGTGKPVSMQGSSSVQRGPEPNVLDRPGREMGAIGMRFSDALDQAQLGNRMGKQEAEKLSQQVRRSLDGIMDWASDAIRKNPQAHEAIMGKAQVLVQKELGQLAERLGVQL